MTENQKKTDLSPVLLQVLLDNFMSGKAQCIQKENLIQNRIIENLLFLYLFCVMSNGFKVVYNGVYR